MQGKSPVLNRAFSVSIFEADPLLKDDCEPIDGVSDALFFGSVEAFFAENDFGSLVDGLQDDK